MNPGEIERSGETLFNASMGQIPCGGTIQTDREIFIAGFRAGVLYSRQKRSGIPFSGLVPPLLEPVRIGADGNQYG